MKYSMSAIMLALILMVGVGKSAKQTQGILFKDDVAFLKQHTKVVVLSSKNKLAQIAVNPDLQGRVMTSSAAGAEGLSFGWINRELVASGKNNLHINAFGGEDRFWLGPEGGQFSIFFKNGAAFDLDHWFTPPPINEGAYEVISQNEDALRFRKPMHLVNYSKTEFDLEVDRLVRLLDEKEVQAWASQSRLESRWWLFNRTTGSRTKALRRGLKIRDSSPFGSWACSIPRPQRPW